MVRGDQVRRVCVSSAVSSSGRFPAVSRVSAGGKIQCSRAAFLNTIDRVASSASRDETRPVLMGVLVDFTQDTIKMVATDSYRLSVQDTPAASSVEEMVEVI